MARRSPYAPLPFPIAGISQHGAFSDQEPMTCPDARNVRGYDPRLGRLRGAQRAGHTRRFAGALASGQRIQHLTHVAVSAAATSTSASVRTVKGIAVAGGSIYTWAGTGPPAVATSGSSALSSSFNWVDSAVQFGKVYFCDGTNAKVLDVATNTVSTWTASAGDLPVNGSSRPRLIAPFRGRIVVSGLLGDSQNWFMSRVGDATDWDYSPAVIDAAKAVAGNNTEAGLCPDTITALIPYRDDLLRFGGDHSIWQMTNDPAAGGAIDLITDVTGIAFGQAWCKDPAGVVYFFGSRGGLYAMAPQAQPVRLSAKRVDETLANVDLSTTKVMLEWDDRTQCVMIYLTPINGGAATHWVFDTRSQAFWADSFASDSHNPTAVHVFDGDAPGDRRMLLGCRDGVIRQIDYDAANDDTEPVSSYVWFGPLASQESQVRLQETRLSLGEDSSPVAVDIHRGPSAESALSSRAFNSFMHNPVSEHAHMEGALGQAIMLRLSNFNLDEWWAYESGLVKVAAVGTHTGRRP